jgi:hypothetical protein
MSRANPCCAGLLLPRLAPGVSDAPKLAADEKAIGVPKRNGKPLHFCARGCMCCVDTVWRSASRHGGLCGHFGRLHCVQGR